MNTKSLPLIVGGALVVGLVPWTTAQTYAAPQESPSAYEVVKVGQLTAGKSQISANVSNLKKAALDFSGSCRRLRFGVRSKHVHKWVTGGAGLQLAVPKRRSKLLVRRPKAVPANCGAQIRISARASKKLRKPKPTQSPTPTASPTPTQSPTPTASPTPTQSPTPTVSPTPTQSPISSPPAGAKTPMDFGAVGNGVHDDTAALQAAFDSLASGETLYLAGDKVFAHSGVLYIRRAGVSIVGPGTLLATNEATSSVAIKAANVTVDGPTFRMASTTQRWVAYEQMKLRVGAVTGTIIRNVLIDGSAAAGLYVGHADHFRIEDVVVQNTRADGIHMTEASHDGVVVRPIVRWPGDDGVAVVSYLNDGAPVQNIQVIQPRLEGQKWGRAFSVVGGTNITYSNVYADRSAGAAIYIAAESEYNTFGVSNVLVDSGTLLRSNQQAASLATDRPSPDKPRVVHGAVMLYNSQATQSISGVTLRNLQISDTDPEGYDHVKVFSYNNEPQDHLWLDKISIQGGSPYPLKVLGVPSSSLRVTTMTMNGVPQPDKLGW